MIYFLGDIHGNFDHIRKCVLFDLPDAVVFLGDIEARRPFEEEVAPLRAAGVDVRWIRGNHDTDCLEFWDNLADSIPSNIDGKVVEIGGLHVAGLGGVFRGEIWYPDPACVSDNKPHYNNHHAYCQVQNLRRPRRLRNDAAGLPRFKNELKHLSSIFWDDYKRLLGQCADVLVTHEAPSCHPNGFAAIDELARAMGVRACFHGHHHDSLNYRVFDAHLGFKAYGVGFCGIFDENGCSIVDGVWDEPR